MKYTPTTYIYVGRLDHEKGVDLILEVFQRLFDESYPVLLTIYGKGSLHGAVQSFASQYPQVTYAGFVPKLQILPARKTMDYCLMPSRFLETFGLSALDSLGVGVPIIAPSKGGLKAFVDPTLTIDMTASSLYAMVRTTCDLRKTGDYDRLVDHAHQTYAGYSYQHRYQQITDLGLSASIILVNDYGANLGGIETLLEEMTSELQSSHHITHVYGTLNKLSGRQKYLGLIKTGGNVGATWRLMRKQKSGDLIWWHSVHRQLGRFPLAMSSASKQHRIMIHDMGLIHPFPSHVEDEAQLETSRTFVGRCKEGIIARGRRWIPLIVFKYLSVSMIWKQIQAKKMLIQVPSAYLVEHISSRAPRNTVICLPHFVTIDDSNTS